MTMDPTRRVVGIDIGGTFGTGMRGALVSGDGSLIARKDGITPRTSQDDLIEAIATMVSRLAEISQRDGMPISAVGIAVPGLVEEAAGMVHRSPNLKLQDVPLGQLLHDRLRLPVFLMHDASAGALAEYAVGVGRGVADMLLVVTGVGVGSAVITGGRVLRGAHGAAGEIGHISIDPAGMICGCGGRGCVETYASETSIARRYTMLAKEAILPEEVIAKAAEGNPAAVRVWSEALGALAAVIATAVALIDCDLVVLSGTLGITSGALAPLGSLLAKRINLVQLPRIEVGALGGLAGVIGAAAVAFERGGVGHATREWREASRMPAGLADLAMEPQASS